MILIVGTLPISHNILFSYFIGMAWISITTVSFYFICHLASDEKWNELLMSFILLGMVSIIICRDSYYIEKVQKTVFLKRKEEDREWERR